MPFVSLPWEPHRSSRTNPCPTPPPLVPPRPRPALCASSPRTLPLEGLPPDLATLLPSNPHGSLVPSDTAHLQALKALCDLALPESSPSSCPALVTCSPTPPRVFFPPPPQLSISPVPLHCWVCSVLSVPQERVPSDPSRFPGTGPGQGLCGSEFCAPRRGLHKTLLGDPSCYWGLRSLRLLFEHT